MTSPSAALETTDFSAKPTIFPSLESMITYSPIGSDLDVCAVTNVGFDSPITKPNVSLEPLLNQFHSIIHEYLPVLSNPYWKSCNYCEQALVRMGIQQCYFLKFYLELT